MRPAPLRTDAPAGRSAAHIPTVPVSRILQFRLAFLSRPATWLWLSVLVPFCFVSWRVATNLRDIPYWDEFDWVLPFLVKLDAGIGWRDLVRELFTRHNEHCTFTSRLLFTVDYFFDGKADFIALGVVGNLFLVAACGLLVAAMETPLRRLQMALLLSWGVFQLQQHENLFWAGSSVGHFQVVLLGVAAMLCLQRGGWSGLAGAGLFSFLSVFNLAQGIAVFPAGAVLLALERRWRHFPFWIVWSVAVTGFFAYDFQPASQHGALASLWPVFNYWLQLIGASPGFLMKPFSEFYGLVFLVWLGVWIFRDGCRREPKVIAVILFLAGALLVIAAGRAGVAGGLLSSRYVVLSSMIWALMAFGALQRLNASPHLYTHLSWIVAGLALFNLFADLRHNGWGVRFAENRENAVIRHELTGTFAGASFQLYPKAQLGDRLYEEGKARGVYAFPDLRGRIVSMEGWTPTGRIQYFIDEITATERAVLVRGWALIPAEARGAERLFVVLQGQKGPVAFSTRVERRPDVAKAFPGAREDRCGFVLFADASQLSQGPLRLGMGIRTGRKTEFIMTDHVVQLAKGSPAR